MNHPKKLIVVFGATGTQGGSVVRSLLQDPQFSIRAITRDIHKPSALALKAKGCEVVSANLNDKSSIVSALKDAYGAFAVTNFWEQSSAEAETAQGKNVADAAKINGLKHLVWSSLPDVTKLTSGALSVLHFDSKAHVEEYIRAIGIPATFFMPGYYMANLEGMLHQRPGTLNHYTWTLPMPADKPIPLFDTVDDGGKFVKAIFLHRQKTLGKQILAATAYYTPAEIMRTFKHTRPDIARGARFQQISEEEFKENLQDSGMPDTACEDLFNNMILIPRYGYFFGAKLDESHSILSERLTTWEEFVNKSRRWDTGPYLSS